MSPLSRMARPLAAPSGGFLCLRPTRRVRADAAAAAVGARFATWAHDCELCSAVASVARFVHGFQHQDLARLDAFVFPSARGDAVLPFPQLSFEPTALDCVPLGAASSAVCAATVAEVADYGGCQRALAAALDNDEETDTAGAHGYAREDVAAALRRFAEDPAVREAATDPSSAWFGWPVAARLFLKEGEWNAAACAPACLDASVMAVLCRWSAAGSGASIAGQDRDNVVAFASTLGRRTPKPADEVLAIAAIALRRCGAEGLLPLHESLVSRLRDPAWRLVARVERFTWTGRVTDLDSAVLAARDPALLGLFNWRAVPPLDRSLRLASAVAALQLLRHTLGGDLHSGDVMAVTQHALECCAHWIAAAGEENWVPTDALGLKAAFVSAGARVMAAPVVECLPVRCPEVAAALGPQLAAMDAVLRPVRRSERGGNHADPILLRRAGRPVQEFATGADCAAALSATDVPPS